MNFVHAMLCCVAVLALCGATAPAFAQSKKLRQTHPPARPSKNKRAFSIAMATDLCPRTR